MSADAEASQGTMLSIRLDAGSGPISGLLVSGGERREFSGWIQLVGLIECLRVAGGPVPDLSGPPEAAPGPPEAPPAS